MIGLVAIFLASIIIGVVFTLLMNLKGVVLGALLAAIGITICYQGLAGFGNPTGQIHTTFSLATSLLQVGVIFISCCFVLYAVFLLKCSFTSLIPPKKLTILWGCSILIGTLGFLGHNLYKSSQKQEIYVILGHPDKLDISDYDVRMFLSGENDEKAYVGFNARGYSRKKNKLGFKSDVSGSSEFFFEPTKLNLEIKGYEPVQYEINMPDVEYMTLVIGEDAKLSLYWGSPSDFEFSQVKDLTKTQN